MTSAAVIASLALALGDAELRNCSTHEVEKFFFDLGTAELNLANCADARDMLAPVTKQYAIRVSRPMDGEALADSAVKLLGRNLGAGADHEAFACMNEGYEDMQPGDRVEVSFLPGEGLLLRLNDRVLAECPSDDAGARYFAIWFGDEPFDEDLRDALTAKAYDRGGDRTAQSP